MQKAVERGKRRKGHYSVHVNDFVTVYLCYCSLLTQTTKCQIVLQRVRWQENREQQFKAEMEAMYGTPKCSGVDVVAHQLRDLPDSLPALEQYHDYAT